VDASPDPAFVLGLAQAVVEDGTPGRALDLLERARGRFPAVPEMRQLLGDLYLFYGDAERAGAEYRAVLEARPHDPRATQGLAACAELATPPRLL
jgi:predicted Zn-dependent protease